MAKFKLLERTKGIYQFMCPGCKDIHQVWTDYTDRINPWRFNGDINKPTVSPSLLVTHKHPKGYTNDNPAPIGYKGEFVAEICHSFIRDGMIQFLPDCTHELAGQTIELPEINEEEELL